MYLLSIKIVFISANSADADEMPLYVAFHLDLHFLVFTVCQSIENEKG